MLLLQYVTRMMHSDHTEQSTTEDLRKRLLPGVERVFIIGIFYNGMILMQGVPTIQHLISQFADYLNEEDASNSLQNDDSIACLHWHTHRAVNTASLLATTLLSPVNHQYR